MKVIAIALFLAVSQSAFADRDSHWVCYAKDSQKQRYSSGVQREWQEARSAALENCFDFSRVPRSCALEDCRELDRN